MSRRTAAFLLLLVVAPVNALQAQLIVDRAGARDVLFGADNGFRSSENKVRVNIDSKEESLALACFGGQWSIAGGNLLPGIRLKAKATDGLKELIRFNHAPGIEVSAILNWTGSADPEHRKWEHVIPFINLRGAYKHDDFVLFDASQLPDQQFDKRSFDGASAYLSGGALLYGDWGVVLSAGYDRISNYEDLPQVEVTDQTVVVDPLPGGGQRVVSRGARTARVGALEVRNSFPAELSLSYQRFLPQTWTEHVPLPKHRLYGFVISPYGRLVPAEHGKPENFFGIALTVKSKYEPTGPGDVKKEKTSFPVSAFVEARNSLSGGLHETSVGVAAVFVF